MILYIYHIWCDVFNLFTDSTLKWYLRCKCIPFCHFYHVRGMYWNPSTSWRISVKGGKWQLKKVKNLSRKMVWSSVTNCIPHLNVLFEFLKKDFFQQLHFVLCKDEGRKRLWRFSRKDLCLVDFIRGSWECQRFMGISEEHGRRALY